MSVGEYGGVEILRAEHRAVGSGRPTRPAVASAGGYLIVSSSTQLCEALVDEISSGELGKVKGRDLAFEVQFEELGTFFSRNRERYEAELVKVGRTPQQAGRDSVNVTKVISSIQTLEGKAKAGDGFFEFEVEGSLK